VTKEEYVLGFNQILSGTMSEPDRISFFQRLQVENPEVFQKMTQSLQSKQTQNFWEKLQTKNQLPFGRVPESLSLQNEGETSHDLEAQKINAIKQKNSKGFRIIDINPNLLSREEYFCVYNDADLREIYGNVILNETSTEKYDNAGSPIAGQITQLPYLRTVQIPFEGTFLKIEVLPARVNMARNSTQPFDSLVDPKCFPQNATLISGSYDSSSVLSGIDEVLLEFESPTGKPHVIRGSATFETYFTNIILTVKQGMPRIRITVGFNSTVKEEKDAPKNLHVWKGHGLADQGAHTPKQFCITDQDVTLPNPIVEGLFGLRNASGNGLIDVPLIINLDGSYGTINAPLGMHLGWITGFQASCYNEFLTSAVQPYAFVKATLYIAKIDPFTASFIGFTERLACLNVTTSPGNAQTNSNFGNVVNYSGEPIRYQLQRGEALWLRLQTQGRLLDNTWAGFSINGYSIGGLKSSSVLATPYGPFEPKLSLTENPYMEDLDRDRGPQI